MRDRRRGGPRVLAAALLLVVALAGCSGAEPQPADATGTTLGARPSSPAQLSIRSPRNGQAVKGDEVVLKVDLADARIVDATTTRIRPDQGHVHVTVDGRLVAMNYNLDGKLPTLPPGTHVVRVEFVAADHLPFDPRVFTQSAFQATEES